MATAFPELTINDRMIARTLPSPNKTAAYGEADLPQMDNGNLLRGLLIGAPVSLALWVGIFALIF